MLDLSRLNEGMMQLNTVQDDIVYFIKYLVHGLETMAYDKNQRLEFVVQLEVGDELVTDYDPDKIEMIVTNLITNAIKYSQEGARIQVYVLSSSKAESYSILVEDNGPGMTPSQINKIFYRFVGSDGQ